MDHSLPSSFPLLEVMSPTTTVVYKRLALAISEKNACSIHWIRSRIGFSLLRESKMCLRGAGPLFTIPLSQTKLAAIDLALYEGEVIFQSAYTVNVFIYLAQ